MAEPSCLIRKNRPGLAYIHSPATPEGFGASPVVFLGGFMSDMHGTKATYLEAQCRMRGQEYLRFDYSGHGLSEGKFEDGTIGLWKDDALAVFDHVIKRSAVLVGSSMGGWIALHLALLRPEQVRAVVGIAAAPDFTQGMYEEYLTEAQKREIAEKGFTEMPSNYDAPYIITRALIEDGKKQLLLDRDHDLALPIRLLQGKKDDQVSWQTALTIKEKFKAADVEITFIDDGDHSLSRPEDLAILDRQVQALSA